ncbi:hypothetical protein MRX96_033766 [Rhipicephalus microplus]
MRPSTALLLLSQALLSFSLDKFYPELRSDLQQFQDSSRCYPDIGEWYQIYRNYNYDPDFGGTAKCVKYSRYGTYQNFTTPSAFTFGQGVTGTVKGEMTLTPAACYSARNSVGFVPYNNTGDVIEEKYQVIYTDCDTCFVFRHLYVNDGYGCTLWRRTSTFHQPGDCCEFIYDENCGTSPKYQIYLPSCDPGLGMPGV